MKESFKKALAASVAVGVLAAVTYVVGQGSNLMIVQRVQEIMALSAGTVGAVQPTVPENSGNADQDK